ncbi:MAG: endonuclease MutS2 [Clostridiaceae bacterium]|jgi:DNA mismatch repair protein MutS2|nr:endonuclease MutS2 [Clostridiaceae bacterium]
MDKRALKLLEYDKIIKMLSERTASGLGRSLSEALIPSADPREVEYRLMETNHAAAYLWRKGEAPFGGVHDIRPSIKRVEIGAVLGIPELLKIGDMLRCCRILKQYLTNDVPSDWEGNLALEMGRMIAPSREVEDAISRAIVSEDEISDHASPSLASIRRSIRQKQDSIKDKLNAIIRSADYRKFMQDAVVTMRGDRYVIPVRQEYKSMVPGLIHDMSASGATVFIEPLSVVETNNEIKSLVIREQQEIERILMELTGMVARIADLLKTNVEIVSRLDFMFAKAKLSRDLSCVCPRISSSRVIKILQGRHPLLDRKTVVPIDIELGHRFTTLVITGPNTGGKTVTLKTVGLFVLMLQAGLHLPVKEGSEFGIFGNVFADIGDEQSIEQSLSTFSSHMKNIVKILAEADESSLVLFDELGAGTDPTEGAALAISILDGLTGRGIRTIATTHYSELKIYAMKNPGVENACCEFDVETLRPTYRLLVGVPGKSNAFAISERLGLKRDVIDRAKEFMSQDSIRFEDVLSDIERSRAQAEREKEEAEALRRRIEEIRREAEKEQQKINRERDRIIANAREEARAIINEARYEAEEVLERLKTLEKEGFGPNSTKELMEARAGVRKLDNLESSYMDGIGTRASHAEPPKDLKPGETVMLLSLNQKATVLEEPDGDGQVLVQAGIMKVNVHVTQLSRVDEQQKALVKMQRVGTAGVKASPIGLELDLRGLNVEEALDRVDKYIDDAVIAGLHEVTLIHGKGTGTLRKAIAGLLRKHGQVESFRSGKYGEGETGVTIVKLG